MERDKKASPSSTSSKKEARFKTKGFVRKRPSGNKDGDASDKRGSNKGSRRAKQGPASSHAKSTSTRHRKKNSNKMGKTPPSPKNTPSSPAETSPKRRTSIITMLSSKKADQAASRKKGSRKLDSDRKLSGSSKKTSKGSHKGVEASGAVRKGPRKKPSSDHPHIFKKRGAHMDLDFWHGLLPNEETAVLLQDTGDFLLRQDCSVRDAERILLSVRKDKVILNAVIEQAEGYLVAKREFESMANLVDYYQIRKYPLSIGNASVVLEKKVRRKKWELRHRMIELGKELGSGSFGSVFLGTLAQPHGTIMVAVKLLDDATNAEEQEAANALWKEARVMQEYSHPHIVKFHGVANDARPYMLVMEFVSGGSVEDFLVEHPETSYLDRTKMMLDAALGMEYLHSKGCIHRDIAARNLLIGECTKVSDFGLTRKSKAYAIDIKKPMNLRWIAPDAVDAGIVTPAVDVYAFGVTIYEAFIVPYETPYAEWDPNEVYERVIRAGYRLAPPPGAPKDVGTLMRECFMEPKKRPTFSMIVVFLRTLMNHMIERGGYDKKPLNTSERDQGKS